MIPTHQQCMLPVLQILADGIQRHRWIIADEIAAHFKLSDAERTLLLESGNGTVIRSRAIWALTYLKQAGLVSSPQRGWYMISDVGLTVLTEKPESIDTEFLARFQGFRDFRDRSRGEANDPDTVAPAKQKKSTPPTIDPPVTPDEALDAAYLRLRGAAEGELLDTVKGSSPAFFERLVVDLLVHMGYGGSRSEAARAIGKSGDGGIDGVIDQDRLGLDSVFIQAKRWESTVGRPEIQKFAGALQGQRASKGVFITTSSFTRDAIDYASRINARIVLIDGDRLASLMFEHDVGVSAKQTYVVKSVDGDYFDES